MSVNQRPETGDGTYPVRLCIPAPTVDSKEPTRMTHLVGGQAISATTSTPPILRPNLRRSSEKKKYTETSARMMHAPVSKPSSPKSVSLPSGYLTKANVLTNGSKNRKVIKAHACKTCDQSCVTGCVMIYDACGNLPMRSYEL